MNRPAGNPLSFLILLTALWLHPTLAGAHAQWLLTRNPVTAPGDSVSVELGSGHAFPLSEMAEEPGEAVVQVVGPDGIIQDLEMFVAGPALRGDFIPTTTGSHRVFFKVDRGEISRTEDGWQDGDRQQWPQADMCLNYFIGAMAFVQVGEASWSSEPLGLPLELQVEKAGPESLTLKAYMHGKPAPDLGLRVWHKGEGFVSLGTTDADGRLVYKDIEAGAESLLISATYQREKPEGNACDEDLFRFNIVVDRRQLR